MPLKKSELYSSLWRSCDELRGGMDASLYKDYVLVLLFMKYVSDKARSTKGYDLTVPKGGGFDDFVALKGKSNIGEGMMKAVSKFAEANDVHELTNAADWNDEAKLGKGKEMVDRLTKLVAIFEDLNFAGNRADGDDLLGDAYEYLMRNFATESGKSKGQFYTPAEVSRIMAKVIGLGSAKDGKQTIHDPTCGSGSLLIKAHDEAKHATGLDLALYGQEMDVSTAALARMNMILHDCATAEIHRDNTLSSPHFISKKTGALETFDFVVANPPFSTKSWSTGLSPHDDPYHRFNYGEVPPPKNGDYAFLLHILATLKSTGKGAIILPHGVLFRGNAEATIRREIVKRGFIKGIIGLPANLFYGTGIPACIIVLDKEGAEKRKGVFMIDASKGFKKDGNKNRLREQDIHKIVDTFTRQIETERYSRFVPLSEIADPKNDYNLNLPRYIDSSEPEDIQDIEAHLKGGIPERDLDALDAYWQVFPGLRKALFKKADRPGYAELRVDADQVKATILGHPEFVAWSEQVNALFGKWRKRAEAKLLALDKGDRPKQLIEELAEDLLKTFEKAPLLDKYDVYQRLMDYWAETMQDDVYLIVSDGWKEAAKPRLIVEDKEKKSKETPDFKVGKQKFKADLIPITMLVDRYFAKGRDARAKAEAELAALSQQLAEMAEEHAVEGGLLEEAKNEKERLTRVSVAARLRKVMDDRDAREERALLVSYLELLEQEEAAGKKLGAAEDLLERDVIAKYAKLSVDEIKAVVVDGKWMGHVGKGVADEADLRQRGLSSRVSLLGRRYSVDVSRLDSSAQQLARRVEQHLKAMGLS